MKKTLVSLAAVAALTTGAMAADKGIDIVTTGQAVVYYNTAAGNQGDNPTTYGVDESQTLFDQGNTKANIGVQLNLDADLKNGFTFGSTLNYLGTLGLEKNLVSGTMQNTNGNITEDSIADDIYLAQIYVAKKMGNTTLKLGRQELPKSLSPFAFSEGWNVFKNTFDAVLAVNTDIPDTTIVGAYVAKGNGNGFGNNMSSFSDLSTTAGSISGEAYMLTIQNKSIPMTTLTGSYYSLAKIGATADTPAYDEVVIRDFGGGAKFPMVQTNPATIGNAGVHADIYWIDAAIAGKDMPLGLKVGVQAGQVKPDSKVSNRAGAPLVTSPVTGLAVDATDTTAYGVKIGLKPVDALSICLAYTSVDGDDNKINVAVKNTTGVKTPLYTQMIANQNAIAVDSNTFMLKGVYNTGDYGKIILQGSQSNTGKSSLLRYKDAAGVKQGSDFLDIELVYKVKAAGINWLAAYISLDKDKDSIANGTYAMYESDHKDIVRFVARYNF